MDESIKKRKSSMEVEAPPRRSGRIKQVREDKEKLRMESIQQQFPGGMDHFGEDFSMDIAEAMRNGGKLPKDRREDIDHQMKKARILNVDSLDKAIPTSFAPFILEQFQNKSVTQLDNRSQPDPLQGGHYPGFMLTTTFVNPSGSPDDKEIPEPKSPRPSQFKKGQGHRAHTSPFSLGGPDTNDTKTVWAPQWANIGVDKRIETLALEAHQKNQADVVHFRLDTSDKSTVGFVSKGLDGKFSSQTVQYMRRDPFDPTKQ